jgi:hypothetical protein
MVMHIQENQLQLIILFQYYILIIINEKKNNFLSLVENP